MVDPGIDAVGIGLQRGTGLGRGLRQDGLGIAPHAQRAQELVGIERGRPQDLREPACHDALVHLHLPQPVLCMDVAQRKPGVRLAGGADMGHAMAVAHDRDLAAQTRQRFLAGSRRLRRMAIPDQGPGGAGHRQHQQPHHKPGQPTKPAHRCSPNDFCRYVLRVFRALSARKNARTSRAFPILHQRAQRSIRLPASSAAATCTPGIPPGRTCPLRARCRTACSRRTAPAY
ncbi:hypothetical protein D9M72_405430 [compost metagenome]